MSPAIPREHSSIRERLWGFLISIGSSILPGVIAILLALIVCGVIMLAMGHNPVEAYIALLRGAFGSKSAVGTTIAKTLPLLIGGLGITIAYRAEIFNIGIEGQILIGGVFAAAVTTTFSGLPPIVHISLGLLVGIFGGMLYAYLPGWLRAYRGINEVIVTLLMNYVAVLLVSWVVRGPLRAPDQLFAKSANVVEAARLPMLLPDYRVHPGLLIALVVLVLGYIYLWHTVSGFNLRFVGANPRAAEAAGVNVQRMIMISMLISGGLGGLAGAIHLQGTELRMLESFLGGYGYDSIAAALVGQLHPAGVLLGGFFFGALRAGSNGMQISVGIPSTLVFVIQGIVIVFVLSSYHIRFGWRWWKREKELDLATDTDPTAMQSETELSETPYARDT